MIRGLLFTAMLIATAGLVQAQDAGDPCAHCVEEKCKDDQHARACAENCHEQEKMAQCTKGMNPQVLEEITRSRMESPAPAVEVQ